MPPAGFEPAIPASERPQTHFVDRSATGIGTRNFKHRPYFGKGDNSQNISFTREATRWLSYTYDRRPEDQDIPRLSWIVLEVQLSSLYIYRGPLDG
jgi:hypothetical protein